MAMSPNVTYEVISRYLIMQGANGATVPDICAATGISRSALYRHIAKNPAITKKESPGRREYYVLDLSKVVTTKSSHRESKNDRWATRVRLEPAVAKHYMNMDMYQVAERMGTYFRPTAEGEKEKFKQDMNIFNEAYTQALRFQAGLETIEPEVMQAAREAIDRIQNEMLFMYFWLEGIKRHKEYSSETEWWAIWPKD